jgi:NitT/TauT family transport system permease protein
VLLAGVAAAAAFSLGSGSSRAVPTLPALWAAARTELASRALWLDLGATLARVGGGLLAGAAVGCALGVALGVNRRLWNAVAPLVDFARAVPPILTFPVLLIALGYGESARLVAIAAGTSTIVLVTTAASLASVPQARLDIAKVLGLGTRQLVTRLYLYELLPGLLVGLKLAVQVALTIAVVTEMLVGAPSGLGARALAAQIAYRADLAWIVIGVAGVLGVLLSAAIAGAQRHLVHWEQR